MISAKTPSFSEGVVNADQPTAAKSDEQLVSSASRQTTTARGEGECKLMIERPKDGGSSDRHRPTE